MSDADLGVALIVIATIIGAFIVLSLRKGRPSSDVREADREAVEKRKQRERLTWKSE